MLTRMFTNIDKWLRGWPNGYLTLVLLLAAVVIVYIAFRGSPTVKALTVAYVTLP